MNKLLMSIAIGISLMFAVSMVQAGQGGGPPGCMPWEWPCDSGDEGNGDVDIDINNTNKVYGGAGGDANINIGNGLGNKNFSPEANATIEKGAIRNTIDNKNMNTNTNLNTNFNTNKNDIDIDNKNTNLNTNINSNKQGQDQDQKQGQIQGQGQGQSQDASNKQGQAQKTTVIITDNTVVEDQYNHIQTPGLLKSDVKLIKSKASTIKTEGWDIVDGMDYITLKQAKSLGKDADDFDTMYAIFFDVGYESQGIYQLKDGQTPPGKRQGKVYLIPDGDEVNAAGGVGVVLEAAMKVGATHFRIAKKDNNGEFVSGSQWNIGTSGGASLMADGGDKMIAPGGGLGFGKAESTNEKRPAGMIEIWFDESVVTKRYTTLF